MSGEEKLSPALWRLLALLMLSVVVNFIDRGLLSAAAPLLKDELGLTASQLGLLLSSFFWTYAAFMVVAGWLADHLEVNWVLAAGFLLWCAATVATGFVHGFAALFAARLVLGMAESVSWPCYMSVLARHFPERHRGIANAAIAVGMGIGPAIGMFASGVLMARLGWRPAFIGFGLVGLLWLPAWLKWMPKVQSSALLPGRQAAGLLEILQQRSAWGTCAGSYSMLYLFYLLLTWAPFYLVRARHFSMDSMAEITGAAYLCVTVFTTISGWLSDRWIASGGSPTLVRKTFCGCRADLFGHLSLALPAHRHESFSRLFAARLRVLWVLCRPPLGDYSNPRRPSSFGSVDGSSEFLWQRGWNCRSSSDRRHCESHGKLRLAFRDYRRYRSLGIDVLGVCCGASRAGGLEGEAQRPPVGDGD